MLRHYRSVPLTLLCFVLTAMTAETARAAPSGPDFSAIAERLTAAMSRTGSVRVAVVPLANGELPLATDVAAGATARLGEALAAQTAEPGRRLTFVTEPEMDNAVSNLGIVPPIGPKDAMLVGVLVDADYVVAGTAEVTRGGAVNAISVDVLDVQGRKQVGHAEFPEGSSARGFLVGAGFGAAAGAAWMAVSNNRGVVSARQQLLALPVGATAEWNAEYAHALDLQRTRLMWWTAAAGAAAATSAYLIFVHPAGRQMDVKRVLGIPVPSSWAIAQSQLGPGVVVAASF